jgi:hypothetical protein
MALFSIQGPMTTPVRASARTLCHIDQVQMCWHIIFSYFSDVKSILFILPLVRKDWQSNKIASRLDFDIEETLHTYTEDYLQSMSCFRSLPTWSFLRHVKLRMNMCTRSEWGDTIEQLKKVRYLELTVYSTGPGPWTYPETISLNLEHLTNCVDLKIDSFYCDRIRYPPNLQSLVSETRCKLLLTFETKPIRPRDLCTFQSDCYYLSHNGFYEEDGTPTMVQKKTDNYNLNWEYTPIRMHRSHHIHRSLTTTSLPLLNLVFLELNEIIKYPLQWQKLEFFFPALTHVRFWQVRSWEKAESFLYSLQKRHGKIEIAKIIIENEVTKWNEVSVDICIRVSLGKKGTLCKT